MYSIVFKLSEEAFMWDSVKCLAEVKDDDIYLVSIVVCGEDVLEGDQ